VATEKRTIVRVDNPLNTETTTGQGKISSRIREQPIVPQSKVGVGAYLLENFIIKSIFFSKLSSERTHP
jgi:hypothetical protein